MGRDVIQIIGDDGYVYVYDIGTCRLKKVCDITERKDIPQNVAEILVKLNRRVKLSEE